MKGIVKSKITGLKESSIEMYVKGGYKMIPSERPKKYFIEVTTNNVNFTVPSIVARKFKIGDMIWSGVWGANPNTTARIKCYKCTVHTSDWISTTGGVLCQHCFQIGRKSKEENHGSL